jgi:hypothetical protein
VRLNLERWEIAFLLMHGTLRFYGVRNRSQLRPGGKDQGSATNYSNQSYSRPIIREAAGISQLTRLISGSGAVLVDAL